MTAEKITAEEFDEYFDNGGDITPYLDLKNAVTVFRVNVDFNSNTVTDLDQEADRIGVSRQALIKMWITEKLDHIAATRPKKPTKKAAP